jgi:hypothetical protein
MKKVLFIATVWILFFSCSSYSTVSSVETTDFERRGHSYYKVITKDGHVILTQDSLRIGDSVRVKE